ncbi:hypothetical protein C8Q70DRAFT_408974 [Cubamyces menziesii]|nr:hypothetical protein C8Q70DRAFT_408974 [Cubamyces menziesii]
MLGEAQVLHNGTQGKFDLVVWNTRGSSKHAHLTTSLQAQCFDSVEEMRIFYLRASEKVGIDLAWGDDMEFLREQTYDDAKKWLRLQSMVVEGCIQKQSDVAMFSYMGTAASVRDMVAMADFFDGPGSAINFWGVESGARVGQYLLQMFPERAGHVVLQSPQDLEAYIHSDSYETWQQDVNHAQTTLGRFVDTCITPEDPNCLINFNGRVLRQDLDWALLPLINMARGMYMGWRNSPDIDLNNTVLMSAFNTTARDNATIDIATYLHISQRSRHWGLYFLGLIPVYCGDKSIGYDPEIAAKRIHEIATSLEDDIHLAPLVASSIFPPLEYLCPLWPIRAVERLALDLSSDEEPTTSVSTGPLVIQYSENPLARHHPLSKIVPGIQKAHHLVRTKFKDLQVDVIQPERCVSKIIFEYLMHGKVHEHLCHDMVQQDSTPHPSDTVPSYGLALIWLALRRRPYEGALVTVIGLAIYAPFAVVVAALRGRRVRGQILVG